MPEDKGLTNHEITIALDGGAILGPFKATWSTEILSDVRELSRDYDAFLQGGKQTRFKYHLHDPEKHVSHSLIINFKNVKSKVINLNVAQVKDQPYRSSSKGSGPVFNESLISESETKHETQLQQIGKKGYSTLNSARETPDIELSSQELTKLSK